MSSEFKTKDVSTPCAQYEYMSERWNLLDTLIGGTIAMREAGERYLPKQPREKHELWRNRLERSILYEGYADTLDKLAGKPFKRPITVSNSDKDKFDIENNVDLKGTKISQFAKDVLYDAINHGLSHILVSFPSTDKEYNMKEEEEFNIRPYWVHIKSANLIGFKTEINPINNEEELAQIRFKIFEDIPDGNYNVTSVEKIKVIEKDHWEIHAKVETEDGEKWVLENDGPLNLGKIALVTMYTKKLGTLYAKPPLEGLAWLNLCHWQSFSDQRNILRVARVGILCATGLMPEELEKGLTIGVNELVQSTNENAKVFFAEHKGTAIEAGEKDLDKLEARMEIFGLQPFLRRSNQTATGQKIDDNRTNSAIHTWITNLEECLDKCYELSYAWVKSEPPVDLHVKVFDDFTLEMKAAEDIDKLIEMTHLKFIRHQTLLDGCKRRGLLDEDLDVEDEIKKLNSEEPDNRTIDKTPLLMDEKEFDQV